MAVEARCSRGFPGAVVWLGLQRLGPRLWSPHCAACLSLCHMDMASVQVVRGGVGVVAVPVLSQITLQGDLTLSPASERRLTPSPAFSLSL